MMQKLKSALLVGAVLGLCVQTPVLAAQTKKVEQGAQKKAAKKAPVAASSASKPAAKSVKSAGKAAQGKAVAAKSSARQAVAGTTKSSGKSALVAAKPQARPVRHAAMSELDADPRRLALYSASALVIDQSSGQPLLEKQPDAVVPIASISKLMTAMVVLDAKLDLQEVISIGEEDVDGLKGTRSRLPVGTTMTREAAMLLALMSSENRAANALGRHYPGGLPAFVQAMNKKSHALGMFHSRFEEPTGLSSNNVSTAHDLARMVAAAARYPEIRQYSTTAEAKVELNGRIRDFHNTNALVRSDNWEIGVSKTGYISEAGRCLVMQARVADKPVVIVLLDSVGKMTRVGDAQRIKRWMESASLGPDRRKA
ncbi:D-alanyl-D-alanine endopeptidase [uncultured Dechloromonas sp.]|uniref:D-alanyl-D-alanine endopeptidase n=1 Tax=uncultured Dechloromonas sp. TaxID=171719 RepID=UPI0025D8602C|nr:D-alanyl-D-alanine endopeptidase [uncultured Dechloromonas sp.]